MPRAGNHAHNEGSVPRTFIAMHIEAGTHPKLVQERVGHGNIKLRMDVYGKLAGKMALGAVRSARLDAIAGMSLPDFGKQLVSTSLRNAPKSNGTD